MIIFINGPVNSGKSTTAKIVVEKIPNTALVEIDTLRSFIEWMPLKDAIEINLENAVSIIKNFAKRKINTVVPYPLSQRNYDYLVENLGEKIVVFTLSPSLDVALSNRGKRKLTKKEKERIKYHYEIGIPKPSFGIIIDNSKISPEETADFIIKNI